MKSLVEFIQESKSSIYDTTIYDGSIWKDRKLVPSEDENKNYIIARLGGHFSWATKGRSRNVDDYIEQKSEGEYVMNIQNPNPKQWEAEKHRHTIKIGTATLLKTTKGTARMTFTYSKGKLNVSCSYGTSQLAKLGTYDIEENPTDIEYKK